MTIRNVLNLPMSRKPCLSGSNLLPAVPGGAPGKPGTPRSPSFACRAFQALSAFIHGLVRGFQFGDFKTAELSGVSQRTISDSRTFSFFKNGSNNFQMAWAMFSAVG